MATIVREQGVEVEPRGENAEEETAQEPVPEAVESAGIESVSSQPAVEPPEIQVVRTRTRKYLPKPPGRSTNLSPAAFFKYWSQIHKGFADRIIVYVYRTWPVIQKPKPHYIDKQVEPFTEEELLHRYGSGDYKLLLCEYLEDVQRAREAGESASRKIAQTVVRGLRDLEQYPPVLDYRQLVLEDPVNRSYVEKLRVKGLLEGGEQQKRDQEEEDMQSTQALASMGNTVENLTGKVIEMGGQMADLARDKGQQEKPNIEMQAVSRGMEIVGQAAALAGQITKEALAGTKEREAAQVDPMAMLERTAQLVGSLLPKGEAGGGNVAEMLRAMVEREKVLTEMIFQIQNQRIEHAERLAASAASSQQQQQTAAAAAPKSLVDQLNDLRQARGLLTELFGDLGEGSSVPDWSSNLPAILKGVSVLGTMAASMVHNFAVLKTGQGSPQAPPQVLEPEEGDDQGARLLTTAQGLSAAEPQQQAEAAPAGVPKQYIEFLSRMQGPLVNFLNEQRTGDEFADWLIAGEGRRRYDVIKNGGRDALMMLLRTYPPLWNQIGNRPNLVAFVEEFLRYDEIEAAAESESGRPKIKIKPRSAEGPPGPVHGPVPRPSTAPRQRVMMEGPPPPEVAGPGPRPSTAPIARAAGLADGPGPQEVQP